MLEETIISMVKQTNEMRLEHAPEFQARVSYCCFFCQNDEQFKSLDKSVASIGVIANNTPTGSVYIVPQIQTPAGALRIVKVRKPDPTRTELGDVDFALENYTAFKSAYLNKAGFKLIERQHFEMMELMDEKFQVRAYFSDPPVEEHPGIKEKLAENSESY